jgi:hypothetical protein
MPKEPGSLKLTFQSITGRIQRRPLDWESPMREVLRDPEAADFVWCRLQYVFRLPDPRTFPALDIAWTDLEGLTTTRTAAFEHDPLWTWAFPKPKDLAVWWRF